MAEETQKPAATEEVVVVSDVPEAEEASVVEKEAPAPAPEPVPEAEPEAGAEKLAAVVEEALEAKAERRRRSPNWRRSRRRRTWPVNSRTHKRKPSTN